MSKSDQKQASTLFFINEQRRPLIIDSKENPIYSLLSVLNLNDFDSVYAQLEKLDITDIAHMRPFLPSLLSFYTQELYKTDPISLGFINQLPEKKLAVAKQLNFSLYLSYLQFRLDKAEGRDYKLSTLHKQINYCHYLLERLETGLIDTPAKQLAAEIELSDKPAAYCGFHVAQFLADKIAQLMNTEPAQYVAGKIDDLKSAKTVTLIQWMNDINERRLYWVWGGGMLQSVFDLLPKNMEHMGQARAGLAAPSPYTGYMSWVLYFTRLGLNLFMVLKHTVRGSWLSEEEKSFTWKQRFMTQWEHRKFSMLNDLIWGLINMACFFWLYGAGKLGYIGNIATAGLLLMDLCLSIWRLVEEQTKHNKFKLEMALAQEELYTKLQRRLELLYEAKKKKDLEAMREFEEEIAQIRAKLADNEKLAYHEGREWEYKFAGLVNEVAYASGLLVAFCFMCCFLVPPAAIAPATLLIIGVTGAALSFILTAATAVINGSLEVAKAQDAREEARAQIKTLTEQFRQESDENARRLIFLDIQALEATDSYQLELAHYHKMQVIRALVVDALIPVVVFAALMFMPMGVGVGVMGAALALIIVSKILVAKLEPAPPTLEQLPDSSDEQLMISNEKRMGEFEPKYLAFVNKNPLHKDLPPYTAEPYLFFPKEVKKESTDKEGPSEEINITG